MRHNLLPFTSVSRGWLKLWPATCKVTFVKVSPMWDVMMSLVLSTDQRLLLVPGSTSFLERSLLMSNKLWWLVIKDTSEKSGPNLSRTGVQDWGPGLGSNSADCYRGLSLVHGLSWSHSSLCLSRPWWCEWRWSVPALQGSVQPDTSWLAPKSSPARWSLSSLTGWAAPGVMRRKWACTTAGAQSTAACTETSGV